MKNIDIKNYIIWFSLFILSILVFNLVQWQHSFAPIFIWVVIAIWLFNTSWIFFYKTLNTKDEIKKYMFSFVHIVLLITILFPFM
jgi:heme O synthase-like polyprenyltransferase